MLQIKNRIMKAHVCNYWWKRLAIGLILMSAVPRIVAGAGVARVLAVRGEAQRSSGANWVQLKSGDLLPEKTLIRTASQSYLDIRIDHPSSNFRVAENSRLTVAELRWEQSGEGSATITELDLQAGRITGFVPWLTIGSRFEIKLPMGVVGVRSGAFDVAADGGVNIREGSAIVAARLPSGEVHSSVVRGGCKHLVDGTVATMTGQDLAAISWVSDPRPTAAPRLGMGSPDYGTGSYPLLGSSGNRSPASVLDPAPPESIKIVRLFYATDRKRTGSSMATKFYGGGRTTQEAPLEYGICNVTLPPEHQFAKLEEYSLLRFETKNDSAKHVTLKSVRPLAQTNFFSKLRKTVGDSSRKEIFVFIHGYNVSWEDSARRAAQVAYDIGIDKTRGAPLLFSWPSQGALASYVTDETNVRVTKFHLASLLTNLVAQSGARHINVLAHSMGNQALTEALQMLGDRMPPAEKPFLNQVVLAAPDVDVDLLNIMAPAMQRTAKRFTLYSCKSDLPVRISSWFHGENSRVGSFALINGFDTIDATLVQVGGLLHHSYVGDVPTVLRDVRKLFESGCGVQDRCCCCFQTRKEADKAYWAFDSGVITNCSHLKPCN